jgi:hypothetical protein
MLDRSKDTGEGVADFEEVLGSMLCMTSNNQPMEKIN